MSMSQEEITIYCHNNIDQFINYFNKLVIFLNVKLNHDLKLSGTQESLRSERYDSIIDGLIYETDVICAKCNGLYELDIWDKMKHDYRFNDEFYYNFRNHYTVSTKEEDINDISCDEMIIKGIIE